jgi:hypothetical protein
MAKKETDMPYIDQKRRVEIDGGDIIRTSGELNYVITETILSFLGPDPSYSVYNAAIGALECAKLELYRRTVVPYEDQKCLENGDVY